jgi:hypothetical protein
MRSVVAAAVVVVGGLVSSPAHAQQSTRGPARSAPWADITLVEPELVARRSDASGTWCEYRARVTLSWSGTQRLWVSQIVDGVRSAPGELSLTGSASNRTVLVTSIVAGVDRAAPLVAEAWVFSKRAPVLLDAEPSASDATCPAT